MESKYESLGFKAPDFVENQYGIKIYLGTKGELDWCVEVPKELAQKKCPQYKCSKNFVVYLVSEEHALGVAEGYTKLAREISK